MLRIAPLFPLLALPLLVAAAGVAAADGEGLPGGGAEAFRERMLAWSEPAPAAPAPVEAAPEPRTAETMQALPHLSSRFGLRADPLRGGRRMHRGIDIPGPAGSPVLAAEGGTVTYAGSAGGYGLMVEIDHGNGLRTRYGHLSRLLVRAGTPVPQQGEIGLMGSTGRSTGSHLHFEVLRDGSAVDPLTVLGRAPAEEYSPFRPRPFIGETAPVHISRFAQDRAAQESGESRSADRRDCRRPEGRLEEGCPG